MRALITGGTGFIGANLVARCNALGISARVLRRPSSRPDALEGLRYESVTGDILDPEPSLTAAMEGCDWVFHLAAVTQAGRAAGADLHRVNVEGTVRMLEAAERAGIRRFVYVSSLAALGVPTSGTLLSESSVFNLPPSVAPYGHSKHLAELAVERAAARGLAAVRVCPCGVLGPRDVNQVAGLYVVMAARGLLRIAPPGGMNYVHVDDVVSCLLAAAERGRVGARYIAGGFNQRHLELCRLVCEVVGRPPPRVAPRWMPKVLAPLADAAQRVFGDRLPLDGASLRLLGYDLYVDARASTAELSLPRTELRPALESAYQWYIDRGVLKGAARPSARRRAE